MHHILYKRLFFSVLIFVFAFNPAFSKSFNKGRSGGHEADMYGVLPFKRSPEITNWLEFVHTTIDFPYNKYFDGLRDAPHQNFSWGKYGHRIFFHWGFNAAPWSVQLQEQSDKCGWSPKTTEAFKAKLVAEQSKRNRAILETTAALFHFKLSGQERGYANALASIVSDVHLLGDYTTENIAPLPNLQYVINDLKTALFERLQGGTEAKNINKQIDYTEKQYPDSKVRAQAVLDILKAQLPTFLLKCNNGYFKNHLKEFIQQTAPTL